MSVNIDTAGHDGLTCGVDDLRVFNRIGFDDLAVLDGDIGCISPDPEDRVEDEAVLDEIFCHRFTPP